MKVSNFIDSLMKEVDISLLNSYYYQLPTAELKNKKLEMEISLNSKISDKIKKERDRVYYKKLNDDILHILIYGCGTIIILSFLKFL
jgi:uncharacterized membrane protein